MNILQQTFEEYCMMRERVHHNRKANDFNGHGNDCNERTTQIRIIK